MAVPRPALSLCLGWAGAATTCQIRPHAAQALEYQMQQGIAEGTRQDAVLMPLSARHQHGPELHANVCVLRLLNDL
jgi:hypothetical protein